MNELDFKNLSDKAIKSINDQLSFDVRTSFISATTEVYMRRMFMFYHQELIERGLLNYRQSDEG